MAGTIRSGRLWCGAGRYATSTASARPSWASTARRSLASAPHAITSGRLISTSYGWPGGFGHPHSPRADELLGGLRGDRRVTAVGVATDRPPELLVPRGAAAQA